MHIKKEGTPSSLKTTMIRALPLTRQISNPYSTSKQVIKNIRGASQIMQVLHRTDSTLGTSQNPTEKTPGGKKI